MGFFSKIANALKKTKDSISSKISELFTRDRIGADFYEDLLDVLISSDISYDTAEEIVDELHEKMKKEKVDDKEVVLRNLRETISDIMDIEPCEIESPAVMWFLRT